MRSVDLDTPGGATEHDDRSDDKPTAEHGVERRESRRAWRSNVSSETSESNTGTVVGEINEFPTRAGRGTAVRCEDARSGCSDLDNGPNSSRPYIPCEAPRAARNPARVDATAHAAHVAPWRHYGFWTPLASPGGVSVGAPACSIPRPSSLSIAIRSGVSSVASCESFASSSAMLPSRASSNLSR